MLNPAIRNSICEILAEHARMPVDPSSLSDSANLYDAGMTSHSSVQVMLALEERFDVEFPDSMLTRGIFESVRNIYTAIVQLDPAAAAA